MSVTEIVNSLNLGVSKNPVNDAVTLTINSWSKLALDAVRAEFLKKSLSQNGKLASTIQALPIKKSGSTYSIEITADEAVEYADKGVSGTEVKYATPYSFKHPTPSASHIEAILKWVPNANLFPKEQHPDAYKSMAWAIATNVKKKGLEPKNFLDAGFDEESEEVLALSLGKVMKKAIEIRFDFIAKTI